jgi:hypothetical protein
MGQNEQTSDRKVEQGSFASGQEVMEMSDFLATLILIRELAFRV